MIVDGSECNGLISPVVKMYEGAEHVGRIDSQKSRNSNLRRNITDSLEKRVDFLAAESSSEPPKHALYELRATANEIKI